MSKKPVKDQIVDFLNRWDTSTNQLFLDAVHELYKLHDVDENDDWIRDHYGEDAENIRLIRTVYLISKFADRFAGKLVNTTIDHKGLWQKIEKEALKISQEQQCA